MKIFGKELFESKKGSLLHDNALDEMKMSEFLVDFYRDIGNQSNSLKNYTIYTSTTGDVFTGIVPEAKEIKKIEKPKEKITPKGGHQLKMLNNVGFKINTDKDYVNSQIEDFKERLNMLKTEDYDMRRGLKEVASILARLENRKKYAEYQEFFEQYPYTMSGKIEELTKKHDHLQLGQIAQSYPIYRRKPLIL